MKRGGKQMKKYIMALDQGTTSCRCILYDKQGNMASVAQKEFQQIYPKPGWVEHDPMEIWSIQIGVAQEAMYKIAVTHENIVAIGITNQRETTILWDKETGEPVYNALVWQCRRTTEYCETLKEKGLIETVREKTGLLIDPYFSATKIQWILDHVEGARQKAMAGKLIFGTVETWLIWQLTKGKVHVTDYSNASRTMLFNIHTLQWDAELLEAFHIPEGILPQVKPSSYVYGETDSTIFGGTIPISGAAGDQQAALFGQTCFHAGDVKNTYGTGCFLLMNTGETPVASKHGLLTTIAWGIDGKINYALEGSIFVAGAVIQWLRDELKILESSKESEDLAMQVADANGVYVVPAFVGLGAPHWDPVARGTIFGLTRGANKNHLVRAALESLAYQTNDLLRAMEEDSHLKIKSLKVDGGASANQFLMQFQADLMDLIIKRPLSIETTSLGAAYLAGLAVGYWADKQDVVANWGIDKIFTPSMEKERRETLLEGWHRAVDATLYWSKQKLK